MARTGDICDKAGWYMSGCEHEHMALFAAGELMTICHPCDLGVDWEWVSPPDDQPTLVEVNGSPLDGDPFGAELPFNREGDDHNLRKPARAVYHEDNHSEH